MPSMVYHMVTPPPLFTTLSLPIIILSLHMAIQIPIPHPIMRPTMPLTTHPTTLSPILP